MAFIVNDRVKETTSTNGTTVTITLDGAVVGYQSFVNGIGDNNQTYYTIAAGSEWEVGVGTILTSPDRLSRDTIISSSNANNIVNFSAGSKDVFCSLPASKTIVQNYNASGNVAIFPINYSANDILVASNATTITALPVGSSNQVLSVNSSGNIEWGYDSLTALEPYTNLDLFYANSSTSISKLAVGSSNQVLSVNSSGDAIEWANIPVIDLNASPNQVTGTLQASNGGTGFNTFNTNDLLIGNSSGNLTTLGVGITSQVLSVNFSGNIEWGYDTIASLQPYSAGNIFYASNSTTVTKLAVGTTSQVLSVATVGSGLTGWVNKAPLNTALDGLAGAGTTSAALAMGGSGASAAVQSYDGSTWSTLTSMPSGRWYPSGAGYQTAAIVIGGLTVGFSILNTADKYDGSSWTSGGTMNTSRWRGAAAGTQNATIIFGGATTVSTLTATTEIYDGSVWTTIAPLSVAKNFLGGCGLQADCLAFGGSGYSNVTEYFDGNTWQTGGNLNTGREALAGAGIGASSALSFGGTDNFGPVSATESYNGAWSNIFPGLNTARYSLAGVGTATSALAFGGNTGSVSNKTEEYIGVAVYTTLNWTTDPIIALEPYTNLDLFYANSSTSISKLAVGSSNQVLSVNSSGTALEWYTPTTDPITALEPYSNLDLFYANSSTSISKLAVGSSNQVLSVNSSGDAIEWTTPAVPSSNYVLLAETSASNVASVDLNGYFTSAYDYYVIYIDDHYGTVNNQTCMQFATTGSYTVQTSNYYSANNYVYADSGSNAGSWNKYWNADRFLINAVVSTTSTQVSNTVVTIYNPMGSNVKTYTNQFANVNGNIQEIYNGDGGGRWNSTTAITGVRFLQFSGNITARKIRMYGIKNS